jgi:methyltransferase (TIGR00027 family)
VNEYQGHEPQPSNTALTAAAARAAHLIVDRPPYIFADDRAAMLLGERAAELLRYHRENAGHPILTAARAEVICRSRYAEDRLAEAMAAGVRQYVLLGAGLDTFAYRSALADGLRVFEVDQPGTQCWKRAALAHAGIGEPPGVSYVAANLGRDPLPAALAAAGFDFAEPAVIACLGVLMYLRSSDIPAVLACLARCRPGSQLIADFMLPEELRDPAGNQYVQLVAAAAAQGGEPWQTFLTPAQMSALLAGHGSFGADYRRQRDLVPAALWERSDSLQPISLSMVVRVTVGS